MRVYLSLNVAQRPYCFAANEAEKAYVKLVEVRPYGRLDDFIYRVTKPKSMPLAAIAAIESVTGWQNITF